jgi:hypothetical protein
VTRQVWMVWHVFRRRFPLAANRYAKGTPLGRIIFNLSENGVQTARAPIQLLRQQREMHPLGDKSTVVFANLY